MQTMPFAASRDDWPIITVVTPSFQQGEFLEETIRSVLLQNYPRLEFVVLDGGSRDASASIMEKYAPWISYARSAPDRGQAHAINQGFALAGGELHAWLNSDDFFLPGTLHKIALAAQRRDVDVFQGEGLQLEQSSGRLAYQAAPLARGRYVRFAGLMLSHATFWRARCAKPLWEEQQCALDYELWIRMLPGAKVRHLAQPLAVARRHGAAKTFDPRMEQRWLEDAQRNGQAHPELYRPQPWLEREYRLVQRVVGRWRNRGANRKLAAVQRACGWRDSGAALAASS